MNVEKYIDRVRGFIQSAQSLAMREGHQQFSPLHILKVLLDDSRGPRRGLDRPCGQQFSCNSEFNAGCSGQAAEGVRSERGTNLSRTRDRARFDGGGAGRGQGWRQLCHSRTLIAGAGHVTLLIIILQPIMNSRLWRSSTAIFDSYLFNCIWQSHLHCQLLHCGLRTFIAPRLGFIWRKRMVESRLRFVQTGYTPQHRLSRIHV